MVELVANESLRGRYRSLQILAFGFALSFVAMSLLAQFLPAVGIELPLLALPFDNGVVRGALAVGVVLLWGLSAMLRNRILSVDADPARQVEAVLVPGERYARLYRAELVRMVLLDLIATLGFLATLITGSPYDCHVSVLIALVALLAGFPRYYEWERWNSRNAIFR